MSRSLWDHKDAIAIVWFGGLMVVGALTVMGATAVGGAAALQPCDCSKQQAEASAAKDIAAECLALNREIQELHQETSFDLPRGYEAMLPSGMGGGR